MDILKDYIKTILIDHTKETASGLFLSVTFLRRLWMWLMRHKKKKFSRDISNVLAFLCGEHSADRCHLFLFNDNDVNSSNKKLEMICTHMVSKAKVGIASYIEPEDSFKVSDYGDFLDLLKTSKSLLFMDVSLMSNYELKKLFTLGNVKSVLIHEIVNKDGDLIGFISVECVTKQIKHLSKKKTNSINGYCETLSFLIT